MWLHKMRDTHRVKFMSRVASALSSLSLSSSSSSVLPLSFYLLVEAPIASSKTSTTSASSRVHSFDIIADDIVSNLQAKDENADISEACKRHSLVPYTLPTFDIVFHITLLGTNIVVA